jgi:hypothetical protein
MPHGANEGRDHGPDAHDLACGCTKCWKPATAIMSVVAVVPHANLTVAENGDKFAIVARMRRSNSIQG